MKCPQDQVLHFPECPPNSSAHKGASRYTTIFITGFKGTLGMVSLLAGSNTTFQSPWCFSNKAFYDIIKKMECKIVGSFHVMGMAWASHFIRPLNLKAGHASPQCSKTFVISKNGKIGAHNSVTTLMKMARVNPPVHQLAFCP